jgi:hypothetical protein
MVEAALRAAPKDKRQLILTAIMALGGGGILAGSMGGVTNSETVAVAPVAA